MLYICIYYSLRERNSHKSTKVLKIYWPISLGLESSLTYCCSQGFELESAGRCPVLSSLSNYANIKNLKDMLIYIHIYQQHEPLWTQNSNIYQYISYFSFAYNGFLLLP